MTENELRDLAKRLTSYCRSRAADEGYETERWRIAAQFSSDGGCLYMQTFADFKPLKKAASRTLFVNMEIALELPKQMPFPVFARNFWLTIRYEFDKCIGELA